MTKHVEMPFTQCFDNVVDIPVVAQRQIFTVQTVQTSVEIPQLPVVDVSVVVVAQVPQVHVEMKTVEITQLQHVVEKTVKDPQFQIIEKIIEIAEFLRFNTSGDEQINLKEHVDRMKEGQNDMCYVTDVSIAVLLVRRKSAQEVPCGTLHD